MKKSFIAVCVIVALVAVGVAVASQGGALVRPVVTPNGEHPLGTNAQGVKLTLRDAASGGAVGSVEVEVHSSNGLLCEGEGCSTNDRSWRGYTTGQGVMYVPTEDIQPVTYLLVKGYAQKSLSYVKGQMSYDILLTRQ